MQKKVCVIIPARGRAEYLGPCLDSVLGCGYQAKELVVVDDGLTGETRRALESYSGRVRIIDNSGRGASAARNLAAAGTDAEYLAFTDSDCVVSGEWLSALLEGFHVFEHAAGGGGRQELPAEASAFERCVFSFMLKTGFLSDYVRQGKDKRIRLVEHNASCNAVYKRSIFLEAGGFREGMWPGEDVELDHRLRRSKYTLFFNPRSVVYHHKPRTLGAFRRMMFGYGRAQGELLRYHGFFRTIQLIPLAVLLVIALAVLYPIPALYAAAIGLAAALAYLRSICSLGLLLITLVYWNAGFVKGLITLR